MSENDFTRLRRVTSEQNGCITQRVEPRFDESWDDLTKLRWSAALVTYDTGLTIAVEPGALETKRLRISWLRSRYFQEPAHYSINVGGVGWASFGFKAAWTFLRGIETGARAYQYQLEETG